MGRWDAEFRQVEQLTAGKPAEAQTVLTKIIMDCSDNELDKIGPRIEISIARFYPKRAHRLSEVLQQRNEGFCAPGQSVSANSSALVTEEQADQGTRPTMPPRALIASFRRIVQLNRSVQPKLAEAEFRALLQSLSPAEVLAHSEVLHGLVASFLRKRQRALAELLDIAMADVGAEACSETAASSLVVEESGAGPTVDVEYVPRPIVPPDGARIQSDAGRDDPPSDEPQRVPVSYSKKWLSQELEDLANHHIFQWSTFYREILSRYFNDFLLVMESSDRIGQWLNLTKASLSHHATDIFQRGYKYQRERNWVDSDHAIAKSLIGLQRFLDLPLEFYSARLAEAHDADGARHLRQLCSAMSSGILIGYSNANLGTVGNKVLPQFPVSWAYVLPFFTSDDLRELMNNLEPGVLFDGVHDSVLPFVRAIDLLLTTDPDTAPLPALSQYSEANHRLEIALQLPPHAVGSRRIEVHCYLEQGVDRQLIEEAAGRGVGAVITPLTGELRMAVSLGAERWSDIVVPTGGAGKEPHEMLVAQLKRLHDETTPTSGNRPIDFNYAALFPLEHSSTAGYSRHVYRSSVRRLMESFERRNGVRLWCSVRRSGKTTACASDLGSSSAQSVVVAQSCDPSGQIAEGGFYRRIEEALESGRRLPDNFVAAAINDCLLTQRGQRVVFVLDEYETLFGRLRTSMAKDSELRYTVVQPLLNQLVLFTRDNLLIFVGQRPDAHWILTDQNQLSPVLIQDAFPLFTHRPGTGVVGEFHELVQKIMSGHVVLDPEFVDRVFAETGGHPFLTAKLLVSFGDWLIAQQRPWSSVDPVRPELFMEFSDARLKHAWVARNANYEMFRKAAADHLSPLGRMTEPWLHAVYSIMRSIALESRETFSVSIDQFAELASRTADLISPEDLLSTASRANFLVDESGEIRPRIPLLGRIAAAVQPT